MTHNTMTTATGPSTAPSISISASTSMSIVSSTVFPSSSGVSVGNSLSVSRNKVRRKVRRKWRRSSAMNRRKALLTNGDLHEGKFSHLDSSSDDEEVDDHNHSKRNCCAICQPLQLETTKWWQRFALLSLILFFVYISAWLLIEAESDDSAQPRRLVLSGGRFDPAQTESKAEDSWMPRQFIPFASAADRFGPTAPPRTAPIFHVQQAVAIAEVPQNDLDFQQRKQWQKPRLTAEQLQQNELSALAHLSQSDGVADTFPARRRPFGGLLNSNANPGLRRQMQAPRRGVQESLGKNFAPYQRDKGQQYSQEKAATFPDSSDNNIVVDQGDSERLAPAPNQPQPISLSIKKHAADSELISDSAAYTQLRLSYASGRHAMQVSALNTLTQGIADGGGKLSLSNDPLWLIDAIHRSTANDAAVHCLPQAFDLYEYRAHVNGDGVSISVTVSLRSQCADWSAAVDPTAFFRVFAAGYAIAASETIVQLSAADSKRSVTTRIFLPDAGVYCVYVRLSIFQSPTDLATAELGEEVEADQQTSGVLVDEYVWPEVQKGNPVPQHPFVCLAVTRLPLPQNADTVQNAMALPLNGDFANFRLASSPVYVAEDEHQDHSSLPPMALCGSTGHNLLPGRWTPYRLTSKSMFAKSVVGATNLIGGSIELGRFRPYGCQIDYPPAASARASVIRRTLKTGSWIHFVGDSVTRSLFVELCKASGLELIESQARFLSFSNPPLSCYGGDVFLTYTPWWYRGPNIFPRHSPDIVATASLKWSGNYEELPLYPGWKFKDYCNQYSENSPGAMRLGWPGCERASGSIQLLTMPTVTYFSIGAEAGHLGALSFRDVFRSVLAAPFFRSAPTLFALTSTVHPAYIARGMTRRWLLLNNVRIQRRNEQIIEEVRQAIADGKLFGSIDTENWLPIFDLYWPSFAAYEFLLSDATHFEPVFLHWAIDYFIHFLQHAPNFEA